MRLVTRDVTLTELLFPVLPTFITFSFLSPNEIAVGVNSELKRITQNSLNSIMTPLLISPRIEISLYLLYKTLAKFKKITDLVNY